METGKGMKPPHILLLEDDKAHQDLIHRAFREDHEMVRLSVAGTIRQARAVIDHDPPDLILADWILPDGKGIEILPRTDGKVTIPLIIMTSFGDEHLAVEIMKSGAIDYVVKSATMFKEMPHIARRALQDWENIRERKRAEAAVQDSQKRLADILNFLPDAVLAIDTEGRVIGWNHAIEQMTGVRAADILGKGDHEYSIPFYGVRRPILIDLVFMDDPEVVKKYDFVQRDDGRITSETFIPTLYGGKGGYLWGTASPLSDSGGNRVGAIEVIRDISSRKQNEDLLIGREATLATLLNAPLDTIVLLDRQGTIIRTNEEHARRLGGSIESVTGKNAFDLLPPEVAGARRAYIEQVFRTGKDTVFDDERSGLYLHTEVYPIFNPGHTAVEHVAVFSRDVTDRKKAELALQESEARFKDLFSNMSSGVAIYKATPDGSDFIIRDINHAVERIEQVRKDEIVGRKLLDVFPGVKEFGLFAVLQRVAQTGIAESHPIAMYRDNRISGWRENYVYRLPSGEVVALYEDVTEKKQAEEALIAAREWLGIALKAAHAGTWDWDFSAGRLTWSPEFYELFGLPEGAPASFETWLSVLHPDDRETAIAKIDQSVKDHKYLWNEYRIVNANGVFRWVGAGGSTTYNDAGEPRRMSGVCIDITDLKAAEDKLRESEERYRALLFGSGIGVAYWSTDGTLLFLNEISLKRLKGTEADLIGRNMRELFGSKADFYLDRIRKAAASGVPEEYEDYVTLPSGSGWYLSVYARITGLDGGVKGVQVLSMDITERKQAEEIRKAYESRLDSAMEIGSLAWWEMDLPDGAVRFDDRKATMLGYSPDQFHNYRDFTSLLHPDDLEPAMQAMRDHLDGKEPRYHVDYRIRTAEGNYRWFRDVGGITLRHPDGSPKTVTGIVVDITAAKLAEDTLQASEIRFRALIQNASDIIRILDRDGRVVYESASADRILGYPPGYLIGKDPFDYIHPDDVGLVKAELAEVYDRTNTGVPTEFRVRKANGEYIWVDSIGTNLLDVPGVNGIVITTRPIQQRKEAEQALSESEERLRLALEGADVASWDWDLVSGSAVFSDRFYTMLGYTPGEFPATYEAWSALIHPGDRDRALADLKTQIREKRPLCEIEYRILDKDGDYLWILGRGKISETDPQGTPTRMTGVNIDITNRRMMESEIRSLNTVLEQRVKDRTEALSLANAALEEENAQRLTAEKRLQASYDEKVMLLKEIHHRVKNNLQIIASLLNLQSRYIKDESTLAAIRESQNRVKAMALVHEKLYRSEDIANISLHEYIRFLGMGLFQFYDAKARGILFTLDIHDVDVDIDAAIPLGLIINELISNSLKYAFPEGRHGEIAISVKKEGHTMTAIFRDTGVGIPAELDWRNTPSLGLRLVNTLVDQMNGTVELDRTSGTVFTMVLHEKEHRDPS
jgi:PAS domain S-box-containing protein